MAADPSQAENAHVSSQEENAHTSNTSEEKEEQERSSSTSPRQQQRSNRSTIDEDFRHPKTYHPPPGYNIDDIVNERVEINLKKTRELKPGQENRPIRIYVDGVFDMTHYGHYRLFRQAKGFFKNVHLIVGISGDEETCRLKGVTVMNEKERTEACAHCRWVDEVICPCPWIITQEFVDEQEIDYVAHDEAPYGSAGSEDIYTFVKKQGKFIATDRTEGVSTTGMINRIVKRYNDFVMRNFSRGMTREDMNVSWSREKRIKISDALDKAKGDIKGVVDNVKEWIEEPGTFVEDFLTVFGPRGTVVTYIAEKASETRESMREFAKTVPM